MKVNDVDFEIPVLFCPIEPARHPLADEMERGFITWMDELGLTDDEQERQTLIEIRAALFGAGITPHASPERQQWFTNFLYWYWLLDNKSDVGESSARTAQFVRRASATAAALQMPYRPGRAAHDDLIVESAAQCAEVCQQLGTPTQFVRWYEAQRTWLFGVVHQVANSELGVMPDMDQYLFMRLWSSGALATTSMFEIVNNLEVPGEQLNAPRVRAMTEMSAMLVSLDNDILGYPMEARTMDNSQNIVNVIACHRDLSRAAALAEAVTVRDRLMLHFLRLTETPISGGGEALRVYVESLRHFVRALIDFQWEAPRYRQHFPVKLPGQRVSEHVTTRDEPLPYPSVAWWWSI